MILCLAKNFFHFLGAPTSHEENGNEYTEKDQRRKREKQQLRGNNVYKNKIPTIHGVTNRLRCLIHFFRSPNIFVIICNYMQFSFFSVRTRTARNWCWRIDMAIKTLNKRINHFAWVWTNADMNFPRRPYALPFDFRDENFCLINAGLFV